MHLDFSHVGTPSYNEVSTLCLVKVWDCLGSQMGLKPPLFNNSFTCACIHDLFIKAWPLNSSSLAFGKVHVWNRR